MNTLSTVKDFDLIRSGESVLVDSRQISDSLGIEHRALLQGIGKYEAEIKTKFGPVAFQMQPLPNGGLPTRYALLTEDQALFIGTLSRNTEKVVEFKARLVASFQNARRFAQTFQKELSRKELALLVLKAEEELERTQAIVSEQETKLIEQAPKVTLANACIVADNCITLRQACKTLGVKPILFSNHLRSLRYLYKERGDSIPNKEMMDKGYFVSKVRSIPHNSGYQNHTQPLVTGKGMVFLQKIVDVLPVDSHIRCQGVSA